MTSVVTLETIIISYSFRLRKIEPTEVCEAQEIALIYPSYQKTSAFRTSPEKFRF